MAGILFDALRAEISDIAQARHVGRVAAVGRGSVQVVGLGETPELGGVVMIARRGRDALRGEIIALGPGDVTVLPDGPAEGVTVGGLVTLLGTCDIAPDPSWIGRIVDPYGLPLDGRSLLRGTQDRRISSPPPRAALRRRLGERLETGLAIFNTLLPLVRGQRIGLFAGSGVGKSSLLARFAKGVDADVVVIALVGERGRELREFVDQVLGPDGMARSIVVAATSDQSPLARRRCAATAMTIAEYFRDEGLHVLLLADSITRFAEAHREVALAGGEPASFRGFPPSVSHQIMSLAERAGPGEEGCGDITAVFTVLVAGSDMDEPIADILRGVLDGHVVMDRAIAERGRFPAVDVLRSVSRSLPAAATAEENALIGLARRLLGAYDRAEMMIQAGLYAHGSDACVDEAIRVWPELDGFLAEDEPESSASSFSRLAVLLGRQRDAETARLQGP